MRVPGQVNLRNNGCCHNSVYKKRLPPALISRKITQFWRFDRGRGFMKQRLLAVAGLIALALGILGIFLPLLPTTPFLLLASACFLKSSERLHSWLITHPVLGTYISNYEKHRAITRKAKITVLILLWGVISYSALFAVHKLWLTVLLFVIALCVTIHVLRLKTI